MTALLLEETPYRVENHGFDDSLAYLRMLVVKYPGVIEFKTGAGHLFFDLIKHIPPIHGFDEERRELCHLIEEHIYPLAASLYAQAVDITVTVSPHDLMPPRHVDALSSFTAFDSVSGLLHHGFLSPHHEPPDFADLSIASGMTIECRPLNYHYHQLFDDRSTRPQNATSNLLTRDYAGRNRDPKDGYKEDQVALTPAPILDTKMVPRWILEGNTQGTQEVMPRISGANGATHIPAYVRLLNVSVHHHMYGEDLPVWRWRPEPKPQRKAEGAFGLSTQRVARLMTDEQSPHPHRGIYVGVPPPGLMPGWYREPD